MCFCDGVRNNDLSTNYWELNAPDSRRDLIIKKVVVGLIALINFAALGAALYFIIAYCPISTQALLISPFIVGVLGALVYLKFPTLGINSMNYSQYSNPAIMLGKGITYLFFGPYMYATKKCDWTPYHDPHVANKIANAINTNSFEDLAKEYGKHFDNFAKYGMIPPEHKEELLAIHAAYKPIRKALKYYEKKDLKWHERVVNLNSEKAGIERRWENLRREIRPHLHFPPIPEYDFNGRLTPTCLRMQDVIWQEPF